MRKKAKKNKKKTLFHRKTTTKRLFIQQLPTEDIKVHYGAVVTWFLIYSGAKCCCGIYSVPVVEPL